MQRRNERANLAVARLMVRQKLQFIAAVEIQQRAARQAFSAQRVQLVQGKYPLDKVFPQHRVVQPTVFLHGQPRVGFKQGGGEQPDTLLAAPVAVFII